MKHLITPIVIIMILKSCSHFTAQESGNNSVPADPPPKDKDQWKTNTITNIHQADPPIRDGGQW